MCIRDSYKPVGRGASERKFFPEKAAAALSHREGMIFHGAVEYPKTALVFAALRGHVPQVKELKAGSGGVRENDRGTAALRKEKGFLKQQNGRVSSVLQGNISFARFKDLSLIHISRSARRFCASLYGRV